MRATDSLFSDAGNDSSKAFEGRGGGDNPNERAGVAQEVYLLYTLLEEGRGEKKQARKKKSKQKIDVLFHPHNLISFSLLISFRERESDNALCLRIVFAPRFIIRKL